MSVWRVSYILEHTPQDQCQVDIYPRLLADRCNFFRLNGGEPGAMPGR